MKQSLGQRTIAKTSRRLLPLIVGIYFAAYLDRTNIGVAALGMNKSLGFSDFLYGWGAGMFFLGYFLFEIPSNIILADTGARVWMARIMITWGVISGMMPLVSGPTVFLVLRFLLGVAEAGFFPGILFYFTLWFPAAYRGRVIAVLFLAVPGSNALGAAISGAVRSLDGVFNLAGWQSIFVIEAVPAIILAIAVLTMLPDRPGTAKFLTVEEREWLEAELQAERVIIEETQPTLTLVWTLRDPQVLILSALYLTIVTATYGITFFLPLIIHALGLSNVTTGLVAAIPYAFGTAGMMLWGYSSDRRGERRWHYVIACAVAGLGLMAAGWLDNPTAAIIALSVAAIRLYGAKPVFWPMPSTFLSGGAAAVGLAVINSIGDLGGFVGPYVVGWIRSGSGSYRIGLWFLAGCAFLSGLIGVLAVRLPRAARQAAATTAEADRTFSPPGRTRRNGNGPSTVLAGSLCTPPTACR